MEIRLYVGNLPYNTTEDDLRYKIPAYGLELKSPNVGKVWINIDSSK
jgi:RNA recognition motif-containing protein